MASYFSTILSKAQAIVSSTTETVIGCVFENPTTSALVAATSGIGGTYLLRSSYIYQRHSTVINTIGVLGVVGGAYLGYSTVRPYINNLLRAKEVLEKSNSKRMVLSQEQITAIDQTNIQSWVVTLDALRNSLIDTYNVDIIFQTITSIREKQRLLKLTDPAPLLPIFNHYRIHIYSRLVSSIVLTSIVRYFNGISVPVTFRYAELDRNLFDSTCLSEQQITQLQNFQLKHTEYTSDPATNPPLTIEETHLMYKYQNEFNSPLDGTFLRTLAQSAVTDVLNLVYQSTLTVLFPVVCQIVTAQLMTNDTPFSFSQICKAYQHAQNQNDQSDSKKSSLSDLGYERGEFFFNDDWIGGLMTSQDVMLCIERAAIKTMHVLLQPSEWFIRVEQQGASSTTSTTSTNSTTPTSTPPQYATMPISDYILGYGYGNYQNSTLREHHSSRSGFTFLSPTEINALHSYALTCLDQTQQKDQTTDDNMTTTESTSSQNLKFPSPPPHFPYIDFKSLSFIPKIQQTAAFQPIPSNVPLLPLLSHLLLPLGPLLHSLLQRLNELQSQPLRVYPSSLSIISSQQPIQAPQSSLTQNPLADMFGMVSGTSAPQPQQQQQEKLIILDSKEIYTRRVLQVIGELHSIMMCSQHDFDFSPPQAHPTELAQAVTPSNISPSATAVTATTTTSPSDVNTLNLWDESIMQENNNVDNINIQLHPWHYKNMGETNDTNIFYPTDDENLLTSLDEDLRQYPFFSEIWKDVTLLLNHTGTILYQQCTNTNTNVKTQNNGNNTPIRQINNLVEEPMTNALVLTKRIAQLFDTLLPSLEQAQIQQQQQMSLQRTKQTPQAQNFANMLLVPQSYAFNLTMTNFHRKYVLDTMMKTIASQVGQEKRGGGDIMDLFGFGAEELGMLQSLLGGGTGNDASGDADLKNMLSLLNPGADNDSLTRLLSDTKASENGADNTSQLPGLGFGNTSAEGGSEDDNLMQQLFAALGGDGGNGGSDLASLLGSPPPTPATRSTGTKKKTGTKGQKKSTPSTDGKKKTTKAAQNASLDDPQ